MTLFFIAGILGVQAQTSGPEKTFAKANELYSNEEFNAAVEQYETIIDEGYLSAQVFYNLGNAYYKLNNLPRAIVNYERALLFDPQNEDIEYNLELSRTFLTDKIDSLPDFELKKWITRLAFVLSVNAWAILGLIMFILILALFLLYWKSNQTSLKKGSFILMVVMIVLTIVTLYLSKRQQQHIFHNPYAIVEAPTVTVKSTPDQESTDLFVIHEGLKVQLVDEYENWLEIKIPNGNKGWMKKEGLIRISDF